MNRREVYATRNFGLEYSVLERMHIILNLPPPLTRTNYLIVSKSVLVDSKSVAEESMAKAAEEMLPLGQADLIGIVD